MHFRDQPSRALHNEDKINKTGGDIVGHKTCTSKVVWNYEIRKLCVIVKFYRNTLPSKKRHDCYEIRFQSSSYLLNIILLLLRSKKLYEWKI